MNIAAKLGMLRHEGKELGKPQPTRFDQCCPELKNVQNICRVTQAPFCMDRKVVRC